MSPPAPLARVARTPRPPYFAVTTTTELSAAFDQAAYFRLGLQLYSQARQMPGFLGLEAFFEDGASVAISYWRTLADVETWRRHPPHQHAKAIAKGEWFGPTITRIARVEMDYGFNLEPADDEGAGA